MKLVTFGEIRAANLPPETPDEDDVLRAIRKNCQSGFPDSAKVAIPRSVQQRLEELTAAPEPEPEPDADEE